MPSPAYELARRLQEAANHHESSWDKSKADELAERQGDFQQAYRVDLRTACQEKAGSMEVPVYLLLHYAWNDALDWAEEVRAAIDGPREQREGKGHG